MDDVVIDDENLLTFRNSHGTQPVVMRRQDDGEGYRVHSDAVARERRGNDTQLTPAEVRRVAMELREQLAGDPRHARLCQELGALVGTPEPNEMAARQVCTLVYLTLWQRRQLRERARPRTRYCPRHLDDDHTFALVAEIARNARDRDDLPLDPKGNPRLVAGALRMNIGKGTGRAVVWVGETERTTVGRRLGLARDDGNWQVV